MDFTCEECGDEIENTIHDPVHHCGSCGECFCDYCIDAHEERCEEGMA